MGTGIFVRSEVYKRIRMCVYFENRCQKKHVRTWRCAIVNLWNSGSMNANRIPAFLLLFSPYIYKPINRQCSDQISSSGDPNWGSSRNLSYSELSIVRRISCQLLSASSCYFRRERVHEKAIQYFMKIIPRPDVSRLAQLNSYQGYLEFEEYSANFAVEWILEMMPLLSSSRFCSDSVMFEWIILSAH